MPVIASGAKQFRAASPDVLDCFAPLAMTEQRIYPASVTVICMTFSPPTGTRKTPGLSTNPGSVPQSPSVARLR